MAPAAEHVERAEQAVILRLCAGSDGFRYFLPHWRFKNRDTGEITSFTRLWRGQAQLVERMIIDPELFVLKAGKLGFSELECAWDGWVALFKQPNARVHLFSRNQAASREVLAWVRFGLEHLPDWMRLPILEGEADANNSTSLKLYAGPDDVRTIVSYPATANVAIDQVATHTHLDEFARMIGGGEPVWTSVSTTISQEGGTLHIVTRGAGPNYAARLWKIAMSGSTRLRAFFAPYDQRAGRDDAWYAEEAAKTTQGGIWQFAPRTWQEALQGDESYVYPMFDVPRGRHIVPAHPCELWECAKIAVGIDLGTVTPTAMGLWGERSSGRKHLYAEFYRPGIGTDDLEAQLIEWQVWARNVRIRTFSPPDEKLLIATLRGHGIDARPATTDIDMGIQVVTRHLNADGITVHESCVNHINEFADYRGTTVTDKATRVEYAGSRPIKHHADAMDEMRYAVLGLDQWLPPLVPVRLPGGLVAMGRPGNLVQLPDGTIAPRGTRRPVKLTGGIVAHQF
jgi:hypothetical protein